MGFLGIPGLVESLFVIPGKVELLGLGVGFIS